MATFSIAAAASQSEALACRIIATRAEVDETIKSWDDARPQRPHVALLAEEIHTLSAMADSLTDAVRKAQVVAPAVQPALMGALDSAERAWAVMDKQLRRLRETDADVVMDGGVVEDYEMMLQADMVLYELFRELLQIHDVARQATILNGQDAQRILSGFDEACEVVLTRRSVLMEKPTSLRSQSTTSLVSSPSTQSTPTSPDPPTPTAIAGPAVCPSKGKGGSFFGGLSQSFQAMTANFRYKPEPLVSALCQSATRGDVQQVKGLIEGGANVDGRNEDRKTALICAITAEQVTTAQWLIDHGGASVRARDGGGTKAKPPLYHAVRTGNAELATLLLHRGAEVNAKSSMGQSHLVEVVQSGNVDMMHLLLSHGGDSNARDVTGRALLVHAVNAGNLEMARQLLVHGADANIRDYTGQAVLNLAATSIPTRMEHVTLLLDHGADPNVRDLTGQPLLVHSVSAGKKDLARMLLAKGADPNVRDLYGRTVLQLLVKQRDLDLIRVLLEHGVSPNQLVDTTGSSAGETLLLHAIGSGDDDLAELLIKHGADPNARSKQGHTPLMQALQRGPNKNSLVALLVEAGASPNMEGLCSPLVFAAASGRGDVVQLLKSYGAAAEHEVPPARGGGGGGGGGSGPGLSPRPGNDATATTSTVPEDPDVPPPDYESIHVRKSGPGVG
ncbi:hypothetical protein PspLS_01836 [Pyricularia sp. CBS 133598]|nr:hypothetical protein PspLS_01836 [Pyricularia sp. CBS 133598]